jgi:hypothetical protein
MGCRTASLLASCAILAGCVAHPGAPARSFGGYRDKAVKTAEGARSAVGTVSLLADASSDGNALGPYVSVSVSEQEDGLAALQGTFAAVQPPDEASEALYDELAPVLAASLADVRDVRIAARRGELADLATVAAPLDADGEALDRFIEAHG